MSLSVSDIPKASLSIGGERIASGRVCATIARGGADVTGSGAAYFFIRSIPADIKLKILVIAIKMVTGSILRRVLRQFLATKKFRKNLKKKGAFALPLSISLFNSFCYSGQLTNIIDFVFIRTKIFQHRIEKSIIYAMPIQKRHYQ